MDEHSWALLLGPSPGWTPPQKTRAGSPLWSLGSGLDVTGGPPCCTKTGGLRPVSHGAQARGPLGGTLRGWQAVPLSVNLPPAPRSRRMSPTALSVDGGPGWPEAPTQSGWGRRAAGGSAVPAGAQTCASASRTGLRFGATAGFSGQLLSSTCRGHSPRGRRPGSAESQPPGEPLLP